MIYVNATKYRTIGVSKFKRSFPSLQASAEGTARRPEADTVASELAAGEGGIGPQSVAGEDAAASPNINVAHCHEGPERPAGEFSPGKDTDSICATASRLRLPDMSVRSRATGNEASKPI